MRDAERNTLDLAELDKKDEIKLKWETTEVKVNTILRVLFLAFAGSFSLGAFLLFVYFFRYDFNPGGISAGDTLFLALLSFGFGACLLFGLVGATLCGFPITYFFSRSSGVLLTWVRRRLHGQSLPLSEAKFRILYGYPNSFRWTPGNKFMLALGTLSLVFYVVAFWTAPLPFRMALVNILLVGIFISFLTFGSVSENYQPWPRKASPHPVDTWLSRKPIAVRTRVVGFMVVSVMIMLQLGLWQDASLMKVGFRKQDVSVRLAKEDFEFLVNQATASGFALNPCAALDDSITVLNHVDILWHKLGTKNLLRFPSERIGDDPPLRQSLTFEPSNSFSYVSGGRPRRCSEFLSGSLFLEGTERIKQSMQAQLAQQLSWLNRLDPSARVRIAVHVDPADVAEGGDWMLRSDRQGLAVKQFLQSQLKTNPNSIELMLQGAQTPKLVCDAETPRSPIACATVNRRVEVYLYDPD